MRRSRQKSMADKNVLVSRGGSCSLGTAEMGARARCQSLRDGGVLLLLLLLMGLCDLSLCIPVAILPSPRPDKYMGGGGMKAVTTTTVSVHNPSNTSIPETTPPPVECPSPPCPSKQHIFLQPQRGPNRNNQQMGQVVTISGVFFPEDCSKGCLFSPPCETCEMEVTYFIYFGSEDAGCNFEDTAASACQCTALSGQDMTGDCEWEGVAFASKYRCSSLTCQVSPLFGEQPLQMFFRDKSCKKHDTACRTYPSRGGVPDTSNALFGGLNYTYDAPIIVKILPEVLPAQGGLITVRGMNLGGDSNYIQVRIDGETQGVSSNPRVAHQEGLEVLEITVMMKPRDEGLGKVEVFVGQGEDGFLSNAYKASFQDDRGRLRLLAILGGMILTIFGSLVLTLTVFHMNAKPGRGRGGRGAARGLLTGEDFSENSNWRIERDNLLLVAKIARGAFGNVYKGNWLGTVCAVKQIDVWSLQDLREFESEAALLSELHHPNIVQLLGVCRHLSPQGCQEMLIVMDYMEKGSLGDVLIDKEYELTWTTRRQMALDAARGMRYLHSLSPPVLHRDLKSPNLLVDSQNRVKIADFGLSRFRVEYTMTFCGSPKWTAPEVLNGETYDTGADVWSYGVVVWELLSRSVPYGAGTWKVTGAASEGPFSAGRGGTKSPSGRSTPQGSQRREGSWEAVAAKSPSGSVRGRLGESINGGDASSRESVTRGGDGSGSAQSVQGAALRRAVAQLQTPELQGPQVAVRVAREGSLLVLPQWEDEGKPDQDRAVLEELMRTCLAFDAAGRPTFETIVHSLGPV